MGFLPSLYRTSFLHLLSLNFLVISTFSSPSTQKLCLHEESGALLQFKNSFSSNISASVICFTFYPKTQSWKKGTDCCLWEGVNCDSVTGHVIGLYLSCGSLSGFFPSNSTIFLLSHLRHLDLSFNDFKGSKIPSEIGGLSGLTHLRLSYSKFSGQVPNEISHLSHLVLLDLSSDSYPQNAPKLESITLRMLAQNLSQIRELSLYEIDMSAVDPSYFMNLSSSLTSLSLTNCGLKGKFPKNILFFPSLNKLDLNTNVNLTMDFPKSNWSSPLQYLNLKKINLSSEFPDSIKYLKSLQTLYLSGCNLKGSFPVSILNLTQVHVVDLGFNSFSGPIPSHVDTSRLSKLTTLWLSNNLLNGSVPSWLFSLPSLKALDLRSNQLTGTLKEFPQSSLEELYLGNNCLQGPIPSSIIHLVNLTSLDLSSNKVSGVLDFMLFSNFQNLNYLNMSYLGFTLNILPDVNFTLPTLSELYLCACDLTEFPNFLKESTGLLILDLSNNKIQGSVPEWLWNIGNLMYLNLSHNSLVGKIKDLPWNIQVLDLQFNLFQGMLPVPTSRTPFFSVSESSFLQGILSSPPPIVFFSVSKNNFSGEIPSLICNASLLEVFDVSHNQLRGKIPSCFHNLSKSLLVLNLQANSFHGSIPSIFAKGCQLRNLNLHGNKLEGQLPRSLVNCKALEVLDASDNNIEDTFPWWLETLPELQVLHLKSNKFHGPLRNSHTNPSFPKVRILDLSNNAFCGTLPTQFFKNLKAMVKFEGGSSLQYIEVEVMEIGSYYYSVVMVMKGSTFEFERTLNILTSIDLSNNNFERDIPEMIGNLKLLKGLNFSHNKLNGHIPSSMGTLINLEWLDLSSNQLVGIIPQEMVDMTSLAVMNLSYNHLTGPIPHEKQFNTFENTSYEGNLELCGFPLSKTCSENDKPKPVLKHDSNSSFEFGWKVVVLGYGCGFIFGLGIGYLVFRYGRPKCFVTLIDGIGPKRKRKRIEIRKL